MGSEQDKAKIELAVFGEFVQRSALAVDPASIRKPGAESEPDIFCTLINEGQVAFELVEICSSDIAATISKIRLGGTAVLSTSDPTSEIIRRKLHKTYKTGLPIELLCYTNGRTVSPDDQIVEGLRQWVGSIEGPFRKVWLLGEKGVYEI
ncbi:hypothetical protein [Mariprofundus ferrooxydans]|uniref:hypothetical protein n=1 Tax=Mariprofundus ferrooxydans TaxID=314344 RepID=UPI00037DDCBC|nr:hypothetical protein [Mariprofundus ferrooxydans]